MRILKGHTHPIWHLAYTPDGRTLVSADTASLILWDLQAGRLLQKLHICVSRYGCMAVSPDGEHLAVGHPCDSSQTNIRDLVAVYNIHQGELRFSLGPDLRFPRHLLFPDARSLLVGSYLGTQHCHLTLWSMTGGNSLNRSPGFGYQVALSRDGSLLASGGVDPCVRVWERRPGAGSHPDSWSALRKLSGVTRLVWGLAFRSGGQVLLAIPDSLADEPCEVVSWDLDTEEGPCVLPGPPGPILSKAISPDGAVLAWTGADETLIHLWDLQHGRSLEPLDWQLGPLHALAFAPDGSTAAAAGNEAIVVWDLDLFDR
jgi:WD40 repeat protein